MLSLSASLKSSSPKALVHTRGLKKKNPDFGVSWVSKTPSDTRRQLTIKTTSDFVKFFTKKRNYNKLFVVASKNFFLSPGIILRHFSDPNARHLKKRPKM